MGRFYRTNGSTYFLCHKKNDRYTVLDLTDKLILKSSFFKYVKIRCSLSHATTELFYIGGIKHYAKFNGPINTEHRCFLKTFQEQTIQQSTLTSFTNAANLMARESETGVLGRLIVHQGAEIQDTLKLPLP